MATAAENYQLANLLFSPVRESAGKYLNAQVAIAERAAQERRQREMMNLKRVQELEDQRNEAAMRERLTNIGVKGQKDIEASQAERDDARFASAEKNQDARVAAAEKKAVVATVRAAYEKYKSAGGEKKLADLGSEDSPDTIYAIQNAQQEVEGRIAKQKFVAAAEDLKARERALAASADLDEKEAKAVLSDAIAFVAGSPEYSDAAERFNMLSKKLDAETALEVTRQKYPAFGAAVDAQVSGNTRAIRAEKTKSPEFTISLKNLLSDRVATKAEADKSPYGDAFFEAIKPIRTEAPKATSADTSNLKVPTAPASATRQVPAATTGFDPSNLSLAGLWKNRAPIAGGAMDIAAAPGRAIDTLGRYGGAVTRGLVTGDYSVPQQGVLNATGEAIGNLIYPSPYKK